MSMAMTKLEAAGKRQIERKLAEQGYPTYAQIFDKFELNITHDPKALGYMEPARGRIVVNGDLDVKYMSVIIRHEILHFYLEHEKRLLQKLATEHGMNKDALTEVDLSQLKHELYKDQTFNYAADYEISNRGYTEEDKNLQRNILFKGEQLRGLVTEDDHPDWVDLSVEEMYDKLRQAQKDTQRNAEKNKQQNQQSDSDQQQQGDSQSQSGESQDQQGNSQGKQGSSSSGDQQSGSSQSSSSSNQPQIGDKGDAATQAKEDAERAAQAAKELNDAKTPEEEQKAAEDLAKAVQDAMDALKDPTLKKQVEDETKAAISKEDKAKLEREIQRYKSSSSYKLKISLDKFIKKETDSDRDGTWRKFNKTYAGTNIIRKGIATVDAPIPLINVYFDQSGSWQADDIEVGEKAMGVLKKYVNNGSVKIKTYYFAENVHDNAEDARREGSTNGIAVMEHIKQTKPDNVIVMTDADFDYNIEFNDTKVPGAVWMLFRNQRSKNLMTHLKGKKETHVLDLEN